MVRTAVWFEEGSPEPISPAMPHMISFSQTPQGDWV